MSKEMREHIDRFKYFLLKENKESNDIIDYYNSKNIILVGMKTNLLPDMKRRYDFEVNGDEIYFFDKGFHFGTLFKEGRFYELKHDGTLDEYGWRKTDDDENVDTIEGNIEYNNFMFNYKVDVVDNLGFIEYSFDSITSNEVDEEYIDENWNDIKSAIIRDLSKGNVSGSKSSDTSIKYYVIDTRNGRTLGSHNTLIDRKAASEIYDIPKSFIEIVQK